MKYLQPIYETSYLTATTNAPRYRRIMRIFFEANNRMKFQLYKEDIYERMKQYPEFEDYTMDQLKLDLESLVAWKNITPIQDPKKVYSIADYKNKQFRYSMSEYAVEIERLTVKLENLFMEGGNLSTNYFARISESIAEVPRINTMPPREINQWWSTLQEDFKRLNQNYQDYLREFYSGKAEKVLKSVEFIQYKDRLIAYLREFIKELQVRTMQIELELGQVAHVVEDELLEKIIKSEMEIPHALSERQEFHEEMIRENVHGKWMALKDWFIPHEGRSSESQQVLEITDEVIRKIIQNAALIVQLQNWGISRKDDYKKFITMFQNCVDLGEAHKLAVYLFGIQEIRHLKVNNQRNTESIHESVFIEEASEYTIKPRVQEYKPRIDKTGFSINSIEKLMERNRYLEKIEEERKMVMKYIKDNRLDISEIYDCISEATRMTLLRWISAANTTNTKKGRTEYGQEYVLNKKKGTCVLHCEDGELTLPAYVFEFTGELHG